MVAVKTADAAITQPTEAAAVDIPTAQGNGKRKWLAAAAVAAARTTLTAVAMDAAAGAAGISRQF